MADSQLVGVWDRFMTPGRKVQYRAEIDEETGEVVEVPEEYDFTERTFGEVVRNFSCVFSERRLVMDDGNHRAAMPGHTQPVELARYSGLAAIWGGKVAAFWDQFPDLPAPDPGALLSALREKFPRATSADGLWGYRREVTPAGEVLLPNMHQTSPQFSKNDRDEAGNEIGYCIVVVSPVYVAHQNGTVLMSKGTSMAHSASGLHAPRPIGDDKMADENKDKKPEDKKPEPQGDAMGKMKAMMSGLPPEQQEKIMAACYAKMAEMLGDAKVTVEHQGEESGPTKPPTAAMSDLPNAETPGNIEDAAPNTSTNFGKDPIFAQLTKRLEQAERGLAESRKENEERRKAERAREVATFSKWAMEDSGRWDPEDAAGLSELLNDMGGDIGKARKHIERHLPPRAAFSRYTQGGHPVQGGPAAGKKTFNSRTLEILDKDPDCVQLAKTPGAGNAAFARAQNLALREEPSARDEWAWKPKAAR